MSNNGVKLSQPKPQIATTHSVEKQIKTDIRRQRTKNINTFRGFEVMDKSSACSERRNAKIEQTTGDKRRTAMPNSNYRQWFTKFC